MLHSSVERNVCWRARKIPWAAGQKREPPFERGEELRGGEHPNAARRELDREW